MNLQFKHNDSFVHIEFNLPESRSFCGGRDVHGASGVAYIAEQDGFKYRESLLHGILATLPSYTITIHDCEGGVWDTYLFSCLPKEPLEIDKRLYRFYLTEFTINPNSGNKCRSLFITTEML